MADPAISFATCYLNIPSVRAPQDAAERWRAALLMHCGELGDVGHIHRSQGAYGNARHLPSISFSAPPPRTAPFREADSDHDRTHGPRLVDRPGHVPMATTLTNRERDPLASMAAEYSSGPRPLPPRGRPASTARFPSTAVSYCRRHLGGRRAALDGREPPVSIRHEPTEWALAGGRACCPGGTAGTGSGWTRKATLVDNRYPCTCREAEYSSLPYAGAEEHASVEALIASRLYKRYADYLHQDGAGGRHR